MRQHLPGVSDAFPKICRRVRLRPDRRFLGPGAVSVAILERGARGLQKLRVARSLVRRYTGPVQSLCRRVGLGQALDDLAIALLRLAPLAAVECDASPSQHELAEKIVGRQKALDPVMLDAFLIEREDDRRP